MPSHPLFATSMAHLYKWPIIPATCRWAIRTAGHISPYIKWTNGDSRIGYGYEDILNIIIPYPNIFSTSFSFNSIVPRVGYVIAIDVTIWSREAMVTAILTTAYDVIEIMFLIWPTLIIANNIITFRVSKENCLRPCGMLRFAMFLWPVIGVPWRVMYFTALYDDGT